MFPPADEAGAESPAGRGCIAKVRAARAKVTGSPVPVITHLCVHDTGR